MPLYWWSGDQKVFMFADDSTYCSLCVYRFVGEYKARELERLRWEAQRKRKQAYYEVLFKAVV
jgi:hypothetical protein